MHLAAFPGAAVRLRSEVPRRNDAFWGSERESRRSSSSGAPCRPRSSPRVSKQNPLVGGDVSFFPVACPHRASPSPHRDRKAFLCLPSEARLPNSSGRQQAPLLSACGVGACESSQLKPTTKEPSFDAAVSAAGAEPGQSCDFQVSELRPLESGRSSARQSDALFSSLKEIHDVLSGAEKTLDALQWPPPPPAATPPRGVPFPQKLSSPRAALSSAVAAAALESGVQPPLVCTLDPPAPSAFGRRFQKTSRGRRLRSSNSAARSRAEDVSLKSARAAPAVSRAGAAGPPPRLRVSGRGSSWALKEAAVCVQALEERRRLFTPETAEEAARAVAHAGLAALDKRSSRRSPPAKGRSTKAQFSLQENSSSARERKSRCSANCAFRDGASASVRTRSAGASLKGREGHAATASEGGAVFQEPNDIVVGENTAATSAAFRGGSAPPPNGAYLQKSLPAETAEATSEPLQLLEASFSRPPYLSRLRGCVQTLQRQAAEFERALYPPTSRMQSQRDWQQAVVSGIGSSPFETSKQTRTVQTHWWGADAFCGDKNRQEVAAVGLPESNFFLDALPTGPSWREAPAPPQQPALHSQAVQTGIEDSVREPPFSKGPPGVESSAAADLAPSWPARHSDSKSRYQQRPSSTLPGRTKGFSPTAPSCGGAPAEGFRPSSPFSQSLASPPKRPLSAEESRALSRQCRRRCPACSPEAAGGEQRALGFSGRGERDALKRTRPRSHAGAAAPAAGPSGREKHSLPNSPQNLYPAEEPRVQQRVPALPLSNLWVKEKEAAVFPFRSSRNAPPFPPRPPGAAPSRARQIVVLSLSPRFGPSNRGDDRLAKPPPWVQPQKRWEGGSTDCCSGLCALSLRGKDFPNPRQNRAHNSRGRTAGGRFEREGESARGTKAVARSRIAERIAAGVCAEDSAWAETRRMPCGCRCCPHGWRCHLPDGTRVWKEQNSCCGGVAEPSYQSLNPRVHDFGFSRRESEEDEEAKHEAILSLLQRRRDWRLRELVDSNKKRTGGELRMLQAPSAEAPASGTEIAETEKAGLSTAPDCRCTGTLGLRPTSPEVNRNSVKHGQQQQARAVASRTRKQQPLKRRFSSPPDFSRRSTAKVVVGFRTELTPLDVSEGGHSAGDDSVERRHFAKQGILFGTWETARPTHTETESAPKALEKRIPHSTREVAAEAPADGAVAACAERGADVCGPSQAPPPQSSREAPSASGVREASAVSEEPFGESIKTRLSNASLSLPPLEETLPKQSPRTARVSRSASPCSAVSVEGNEESDVASATSLCLQERKQSSSFAAPAPQRRNPDFPAWVESKSAFVAVGENCIDSRRRREEAASAAPSSTGTVVLQSRRGRARLRAPLNGAGEAAAVKVVTRRRHRLDAHVDSAKTRLAESPDTPSIKVLPPEGSGTSRKASWSPVSPHANAEKIQGTEEGLRCDVKGMQLSRIEASSSRASVASAAAGVSFRPLYGEGTRSDSSPSPLEVKTAPATLPSEALNTFSVKLGRTARCLPVRQERNVAQTPNASTPSARSDSSALQQLLKPAEPSSLSASSGGGLIRVPRIRLLGSQSQGSTPLSRREPGSRGAERKPRETPTSSGGLAGRGLSSLGIVFDDPKNSAAPSVGERNSSGADAFCRSSSDSPPFSLPSGATKALQESQRAELKSPPPLPALRSDAETSTGRAALERRVQPQQLTRTADGLEEWIRRTENEGEGRLAKTQQLREEELEELLRRLQLTKPSPAEGSPQSSSSGCWSGSVSSGEVVETPVTHRRFLCMQSQLPASPKGGPPPGATLLLAPSSQRLLVHP